MADFEVLREDMVRRQISARGIRDELVLDAMRTVPREKFVPEHVQEFAYNDHALPIEQNQTISQPYIVALMTEALQLSEGDRVLEVGTGSGYAAAVLSRIAEEVFSIERHEYFVQRALEIYEKLGYENIQVRSGDGTLGWPEEGPFDAISVTAGGPEIPESLKEQLAPGGRLVIPIGSSLRLQKLVRVTRTGDDQFETEELSDVRFVPLIGEQGWKSEDPASPSTSRGIEGLLEEEANPISDLKESSLESLVDRLGEARVVLLGEASHGTSEFYHLRERLTRELITRKGFNLVCVEADWPDARRIDHYVRHLDVPRREWTAFSRFPTWMWRNQETLEFVEWLREHNRALPPDRRTGFFGLDLYSLYRSIHEILGYLRKVDPDTAELARRRYGCLTPWEDDPATYGQAALTGRYESCEGDTVAMLQNLLEKEFEYERRDGEEYFDAVQNARLVRNAEKYYRIMYYGGTESWNHRDRHMFETLEALLGHRKESKALVWAHNSHVGDAEATEMSARGETNLGRMSRDRFGKEAAIVGFGTHEGEVAAASFWGGEMEVKKVRPALGESYEALFHSSTSAAFHLSLVRNEASRELTESLREPRLERAIGVIYRPETERASHYFRASLPLQFDHYLWIDRSSAVKPLEAKRLRGLPETFPFGV